MSVTTPASGIIRLHKLTMVTEDDGDDALAWLLLALTDCSVVRDHALVIGRVIASRYAAVGGPLIQAKETIKGLPGNQGGQMPKVEIIKNVFRSGFALTDLAWVPWVERGRAGVDHYPLWLSDGAREQSVGLLLRFPPGAHGDFHEHLGYELMVVLDGTLDHSDGRTFVKGDLIVEAPGTRHQMSSAQGCTVLAIRTRPAAARAAEEGEIAPSRREAYMPARD
jgi:hypothetical protein